MFLFSIHWCDFSTEKMPLFDSFPPSLSYLFSVSTRRLKTSRSYYGNDLKLILLLKRSLRKLLGTSIFFSSGNNINILHLFNPHNNVIPVRKLLVISQVYRWEKQSKNLLFLCPRNLRLEPVVCSGKWYILYRKWLNVAIFCIRNTEYILGFE